MLAVVLLRFLMNSLEKKNVSLFFKIKHEFKSVFFINVNHRNKFC
jgi:hypothetical protein